MLIAEPIQYKETIPVINEFPSGPATSFREQFFKKMKDSQAKELATRIKSFVDSFLKQHLQLSISDQGTMVHQFIEETMPLLQEHVLWKGASTEEFEECYECIEKYIMGQLYQSIFCTSQEQKECDKQVADVISKVQWITPLHLEIRIQQNERRLYTAINELRKMDTYKSPRDKMTCILNCCRALYSILNKASKEGHPAGADEFLPLLIYTVVQANPPRFQSNLDYIQYFRKPGKLITETGYYLTHLVSALSFLQNLDASCLKIDPDEYNRFMNIPSEVIPQVLNGSKEKKIAQEVQTSTNLDSEKILTETRTSLPETNLSEKSSQNNTSKMSHDSPEYSENKIIVITSPNPEIPLQPVKNSRNGTPMNGIASSTARRPSPRGNIPSPKKRISPKNGSASSQSIISDSEYGTDSLDSFAFGEENNNDLEDFYTSAYETEAEMRRFLTCTTDELLIGDVPKLLAMFKEIAAENSRLKDELEKSKIVHPPNIN